MTAFEDHWVLLRVTVSGDSCSIRLTSEHNHPITVRNVSWKAPGQAFEPINERLREVVKRLPPRKENSPDRISLALFFQFPGLPPPSPWRREPVFDSLSDRIRRCVGPKLVQPIWYAPGKVRPPFSLPFKVLAVGAVASRAIRVTLGASWLRDPSVSTYGMRIESLPDPRHSELESYLREDPQDLLVVTDLKSASRVCRALPLKLRPRLVVSMETRPRVFSNIELPEGMAVVRVPVSKSVRWGPFLADLVDGLVHDLPIHDAVRAAIKLRDWPPRANRLLILGSAATNQQMRIRDALVSLQRDADQFVTKLPDPTRGDFLSALEGSDNPATIRAAFALRQRLEDASGETAMRIQSRLTGGGAGGISGPGRIATFRRPSLLQVRDEAAAARGLPQDFRNFERETSGLVPMARAAERLYRLKRWSEPSLGMFKNIATDPEMSRLLREHQDRAVDIGVQRLDTRPTLQALDTRTSLEAGRKYEIRVHVGNPLPDSIVVGERPPVVPLLPHPKDARGHLLEVAVQGKNFQVLSKATLPLRLPVFAGSAPIYFTVQAPVKAGKASLRVHLYYRNHLVQTYLLDALVTEREKTHSRNVVSASIVYSRLRRLTDVERVRERSLSIGVNSSNAATHEVIVKGTGVSGEVTLFPTTFNTEVGKFQTTLAGAMRDARNPRGSRIYPTIERGDNPPTSVSKLLREFADQGRNLYDAFFLKVAQESPALRKQLVKLQDSTASRIQVVRFDENFVFPWTLLYDFLLPDSQQATGPSDFCLGYVRDTSGKPMPCGHTATARKYCINGFWSVRHYVEELIGKGDDLDDAIPKPAAGAIRIVANASIGPVAQMKQGLSNLAGAQVVSGPEDETQLLDLLWQQPPQRPSVLVVLGHMEAAGRVEIVPSKHWLTMKGLIERGTRSAEAWSQPRPIVLLMACESVQSSVEVFNSFVSALHAAGAAAIVGTEAVVAGSLAAECAEHVTREMWGGSSLGEAMTGFRRKTLERGNPLAFVFHAIGNVDLKLA